MIRKCMMQAFMASMILLFAFAAKAQSDPSLDSVLKGKDNKLVIGAQAYVKDVVFFDPLLKPTIYSTNRVSNVVNFRIDEYSSRLLPDSFKVDASVRIIYTDANSVKDSVTKTLSITYNKARPYTSKAWFYFNNAYEVNVRVLSLTAQYAVLDSIINVLELENEMIIDRDYKLNCAEHSIKTVSKNTTTVGSKGELQVSWPSNTVSEEYDLEWTYIDKSALESGRYNVNGQLNANMLFRFNASRVTLNATTYNIPLLYDGDGKLFFRVRGAQTLPGGRRITTAWSSDFISDNGLGEYDFAGHERKLNWQSSTSFAEEGKRKTVVQYFDGSLKGRQTVTKDNTSDTTIIAETYYDQQGRPVIQVLPAPSLSSIINFTPRFNTINGAEYDKGNYDTSFSAADYCGTAAPKMDSSTGTARYYSRENQNVQQTFHQYIPESYGYVFTETKYQQDNTGRINSQGGVGKEFRLGTGRETKYYYGEPDQEELDALFGTEAGYASHYQKNMVRDANGQYSVSYVDMHGRTVATALAGTSPTNVEALASNTNATVTTKLLNSTNNLVKGTAIESVKGLIVTRAGNHVFNYSLTPESLGLANCTNTTICYDCLYDLEITVTDDCNNQNMPGDTAYRYTYRNFSFGSIDTTCSPAAPLTFSKTLLLPEGSYTVTKRLSINEEAMRYYRDSVFLAQNTCKSYEDIVNEQRTVIKNQLGNCNTDTLNTPYYKSYREQMMMDVSPPSGQYADIDSVLVHHSIFDEISTNFFRYQKSTLLYKNEEGVLDTVYIDGVAKTPNQLSPQEFIDNFKYSWAEELIKEHPEYEILVAYEKLSASHLWDEGFEKTDTYAEALARGYLNPTGSSSQPAAKFTIVNNGDPLFTSLTNEFNATVSNTARQLLTDSLLLYRRGTYNSQTKTFSAWGLATILAKCPQGLTLDQSCADTWNTNTNIFGTGLCVGELDMAWRFFRTTYQTLKQNWVDNFVRSQSGFTAPEQYMVAVFPKQSDLLQQMGISDVFNTDTAALRTKTNAQLAAQIDSSCNQYAKIWIERLGTCNYTQADLDIIIPRLVQVCKEGGDASRPLGSSTVKPSSTYQYKSFDDVIKDYNASHGLSYGVSCNGYLIDAPKPYGTAFVTAAMPTYQKPDSCGCARISAVYSQYLPDSNRYNSFSDFLYKRYKATISQGALDTLRNLCNGTITCRFIPEMIKVPAALQCGMENSCADCGMVRSRYDSFKVKFPASIPALTDTSEAQQTSNLLFANFMNQQLGLGKSAVEYLQFLDSCKAYSSTPACDLLSKIVDDYRAVQADMNAIKAVRGYRLTTVKDEIIEGINGLLEWRQRLQNNRQLSARYRYVPVNRALNNKFYSIANSTYSYPNASYPVPDTVFNMTLPLNVDYIRFVQAAARDSVPSFKANQSVHDTDFTNLVKSSDLSKKFFAVSMMDEWGRFRMMWGGRSHWDGASPCSPTLAGYYGLNGPPSEFLMPFCKEISNGYLGVGFYKMPQANPTITEYNNYRSTIGSAFFGAPDDRLPTGALRDSLKYSERIYHNTDIRKVLDFYIDTSLLKQFNPASNNYADTINTRFVRAKLLMINGDTINAYVYDNMSLIFKQKVDTTIYDTDCQAGFRAYYNLTKGTNYTYAQIDSIYQGTCGRQLDICSPVNCNSLENELSAYYYSKIKPANGYVDMPIRTFAGNITPSEGPKGVFDINGNLIGNTVDSSWLAVNQSFATIWNSSAVNSSVGTLSALPDGLMRLTLKPGQEAPCNGIIGQRYYQFEVNVYDTTSPSIRTGDGSYISFGDSSYGFVKAIVNPYPNVVNQVNISKDPKTKMIESNFWGFYTENKYYIPDGTPRKHISIVHYYNKPLATWRQYTVTVYHTDVKGNIGFNGVRRDINDPATSPLKNLRGFIPQQTLSVDFTTTQDSTICRTSQIRNFSQISSIESFQLGSNSGFPFGINLGSFANNHRMLSLRFSYSGPKSTGYPSAYIGQPFRNIVGTPFHEVFPDLPKNFPKLRTLNAPSYFGIEYLLDSIKWELPKLRQFQLTWNDTMRAYQIDSLLNQLARVNNETYIDGYRPTALYGYASNYAEAPTTASAAAIQKLTNSGWNILNVNSSSYIVDPIYTFSAIVDYDSLVQTNSFTDFFNTRHGTNYTFPQLQKLYKDSCGKALDLCNLNIQSNSGLRLCNETVGEEVTLVQPDACSDSTLLIATTATEIYRAYKDSILSSFQEAYVQKCLGAVNLESFSVNRPVSEYHYTLYYYDQAGNLVKTISPEGVQPNRDANWLTQVAQKRTLGQWQVPAHSLPVVYRYNSLNQVVSQYSPDGGLSRFWYDRLGRLVISQNAKQQLTNNYSYTKYDWLGRITEVGEKQQPTAMTNSLSRNNASLGTWLSYTYTFNSQTVLAQQVTKTVYDLPATLPLVSGTTAYNFHQKAYTLRNRVSYTSLIDALLPGSPDPQYVQYNSATYYSYDIHGNVDTLLQDYRLGLMAGNGANRFKLVAYQYDLISGKVNEVHYQPGEKDQFFHRYAYDAENRLTDVYTTNVKEFVGQKGLEDHDAQYTYYRHGPLARTVLGQLQVQGIDYAYTLQGWLKGVNATALRPDRDMGRDDGSYIARDAYSFALNYYSGDYTAINTASRNPFPGHSAYLASGENKELFNGNISSMAVNISKFAPMLYNYRYDQLNRIVRMDAYTGLKQSNNDWSALTGTLNYQERVSYDPNGNILTYSRNGTTAEGRPLAMDNLTYNYFTDGNNVKRNNRLRLVRDAVSDANYTEDIDDQLSAVANAADSNYVYDAIGNLIQDKAEKITDIKWNVYGKILEITKTATAQNPVTKISYSYDAAGNRISKSVTKSPSFGGGGEVTWYVRDAQGNVLGTYTDKNALTLTEQHIYGSSRLGITNKELVVADPSLSGTNMNLTGTSYSANFERGKKFFELTNHLGNVLVTISDRKLQVINGQGEENNGNCEPGSGQDIINVPLYNNEASFVAKNEVNFTPGFTSSTGADFTAYTDASLTACVITTDPPENAGGWHFVAEVVSANDYYPFGMLMPGRKYSAGTYRYGFNGKEMDNDVSGNGNQYDYGFRIYNPRLGRFLSVDPLVDKYPMLTPYQFAANMPVIAIDIDGKEADIKIEYHSQFGGKPFLTIINKSDILVDDPSTRTDIAMSNLQTWRSGTWTIHKYPVKTQSGIAYKDFGNATFTENGVNFQTGRIDLTSHTLGILSEKYESHGAGTVSSGKGDRGGVSYGAWQLASKLGRPEEFLAGEGSVWANEFGNTKSGSSEFSAIWRKIAKMEPESFKAAQHAYIKRTHYDVTVANIQSKLGIDINSRSSVLQDVVWSTSVQHGPGNNIVQTALKGQNVSTLSDADIIKLIYAERGRKDSNGNLVHFSNNSASVQKGVSNRFKNEKNDALERLNK